MCKRNSADKEREKKEKKNVSTEYVRETPS